MIRASVESNPLMLLGISSDDLALIDRVVGGWEAEEVGMEIGDLSEPEARRAEIFLRRGFLTCSGGWHASVWFRVSVNGRMLLHLRDDLLGT